MSISRGPNDVNMWIEVDVCTHVYDLTAEDIIRKAHLLQIRVKYSASGRMFVHADDVVALYGYPGYNFRN